MIASPATSEPPDVGARRAVWPVVCYPVERLRAASMPLYLRAKETLESVAEVVVLPCEGRCFLLSAGHFFRIHSVEGAQVGDLNLWNAGDLSERFYSVDREECTTFDRHTFFFLKSRFLFASLSGLAVGFLAKLI